VEAYFEYVRVEAAVVPVDIVSFFCAQAPKLKALAKTVTIMIAFKILILFLTPFVAGCCRALYKRTQTAQRFSPPPTITR
jgi:hypothetical protein